MSTVDALAGFPLTPAPLRGPAVFELDVWLTARWGAHTRNSGRTWWVPNRHAPWTLQSAEIVECEPNSARRWWSVSSLH